MIQVARGSLAALNTVLFRLLQHVFQQDYLCETKCHTEPSEVNSRSLHSTELNSTKAAEACAKQQKLVAHACNEVKHCHPMQPSPTTCLCRQSLQTTAQSHMLQMQGLASSATSPYPNLRHSSLIQSSPVSWGQGWPEMLFPASCKKSSSLASLPILLLFLCSFLAPYLAVFLCTLLFFHHSCQLVSLKHLQGSLQPHHLLPHDAQAAPLLQQLVQSCSLISARGGN